MNEQIIKELFSVLKKRTKTSEKKSYTSHLIKNPDLLAKKIGEESAELIIDFVKKNKDGAIKESADLIYHIFVVWISMGIDLDEIWNELSSRQLKSGFEEKRLSFESVTEAISPFVCLMGISCISPIVFGLPTPLVAYVVPITPVFTL